MELLLSIFSSLPWHIQFSVQYSNCGSHTHTHGDCDNFDERPGTFSDAIRLISWFQQALLKNTSSVTFSQLQMIAIQSEASTKTQKLWRRGLSDVVGERWLDELLQSGPRCFNSYLFLFLIQRSSCFKWTALRGTKICPWRHDPNSRESWQLLRIDGTLMDIKAHNGWMGKQKGVKEWWWKENVHSQRGTKKEVCEWEMERARVFEGKNGRGVSKKGLQGVVGERE